MAAVFPRGVFHASDYPSTTTTSAKTRSSERRATCTSTAAASTSSTPHTASERRRVGWRSQLQGHPFAEPPIGDKRFLPTGPASLGRRPRLPRVRAHGHPDSRRAGSGEERGLPVPQHLETRGANRARTRPGVHPRGRLHAGSASKSMYDGTALRRTAWCR